MKRAGGFDVARATVPDMSRTPRRIAGRLIKVVAAIAVVLGVASLPSSAAESPDYPGLPDISRGGDWVGPRATGINEVAAAKQWVRLPPLFAIAYNDPLRGQQDSSCRRLKPYESTTTWHASLFYISTSEGAPKSFGTIGPFTVRTVAFGSIPVEARVLIAQPRDDQDLPIGYDLTQLTHVFCAPGVNGAPGGPHAGPGEKETYWEPVELQAPTDISIVSLKVDGVDLDLQEGCTPGQQSVMSLTSRPYYDLDPEVAADEKPTAENLMTTPFFGLANGGLLTGTIDIAPFAGCRTSSGEDVSALLTATVSGKNNKVQVRSEGLQVSSLPCAADRSQCTNPLPGLSFPEGNE